MVGRRIRARLVEHAIQEMLSAIPRKAFAYRKLALSVVMIAIVLAAGSMVTRWLILTRPVPQRAGVVILPPLVKVQRIVPEDIQEVFVGYGSARADVKARLNAELGGVIVEVAQGLKDGSEVAKEQLLVRIDDRDHRQQLIRAESMAADIEARMDQLEVEKGNLQKLLTIVEQEVNVNRDEMTRLTNLFEEEQASKKEVDFARLAYQRSRRESQGYRNQIALVQPRRASLEATRSAFLADVALAGLTIEKCRITAPFSGQVVRISVDVGDRVLPGSEILHLISPGLIEVPVELPASVRPRVAVGATCTLQVESMPGMEWEGVVSRISPVADERSRTFAAYIEVDNDRQAIPLVPGYFLTARVAGPVLVSALAVPRGAIIDDHLFVANASVAHVRRVKVERYLGERAVVSGDLKPGDLVILTNLDKLTDGTRVRTEAPETVQQGDGSGGQTDLVLSGNES